MLKSTVQLPFRLGLMLTLCCAMAVAASAEEATDTTNPATAKPAPALSPERAMAIAINKAVTTLSKEWVEGMRNNAGLAKLRQSSDYFNADNSADITPAGIVDALSREYGQSAGESCYIKFQLLSAVSGKFDDKLAEKAIQAYANSGKLTPYPETDPSFKNKLDQAILHIPVGAESQLSALSSELTDRKDAITEQDRYILLYRDELFKRLPFAGATIEAGWADYTERVKSGVESGEGFLQTISTATRAYAESGSASPDAIRTLANGLGRLNTMKSPPLYKDAVFDEKNKKNIWQQVDHSGEGIGGDPLKALVKDLQEKAANPGGGLQFKKDG